MLNKDLLFKNVIFNEGIKLLDDEALLKLIKAGRIAKETINYTYRLIKPGVRILDIAIEIENKIKSLGGMPAFPVNIGINSIAAHYTPLYNDNSIIPDNSIVKIDIGVHVDGYIADTAVTISLNPVYEGLVEATRNALEKALGALYPGIRALEIGRIIEDTIKSAGFKPVKNLSGHSIDRYNIHSGITLPNYDDVLSRHKLFEGVYAIEPFGTNGNGLVSELKQVTIYSLKHNCRLKQDEAKTMYEMIYSERRTLPFTPRWYVSRVQNIHDIYKLLLAFKNAKCLVEYPVLVESSNGMVAQFEHTIVIAKNNVIVTTL